jgi:hypothetical protein
VKDEDIKKVEESINEMRALEGRRLQEVKKEGSDVYMNFVDSECDLSESSLLKDCDFSWDVIQSED